MKLVDLAAIWGAGVATTVALYDLWKAAADRPSIRGIDDPSTNGLGALDSVGKRHSIPSKLADDLINQSRALPSNRRQYRKKGDLAAPLIWAWQIRDPVKLNRRSDDAS